MTFGPGVVIAQEFFHTEGVDQVVIYGSWARRHAGEPGREPAGRDVTVIGSPDRDAVYAAAERAEARLGFPVNSTVRTSTAWPQGSDPLVITAKRDALVVLAEGRLSRLQGADAGVEGFMTRAGRLSTQA